MIWSYLDRISQREKLAREQVLLPENEQIEHA
jgi:hypothetical protein